MYRAGCHCIEQGQRYGRLEPGDGLAHVTITQGLAAARFEHGELYSGESAACRKRLWPVKLSRTLPR